MSRPPVNFRAIFEFVVVGICTASVSILTVGIGAALLRHNAAGQRDFVEYWAAGHQLIHHANPYDSDAILKLELSAGYPSGISAQVMGNPPSAVLATLPLGFFGPMAGELFWVLLLLASLFASVQMIRSIHGRPKNLLHLLAYAFAPALSCLLAGQVSLFVLLGLVLFLRWNRSRPFLAGASLWLCLLKPHLFLPFGAVLLVWIVLTRSYRILAGAAAALGVSCAAATILNPAIWVEYAQAMSTQRIDRLPVPSLCTMLRQNVYPHTLWLQCLPACAGCLWALFYFLKRRKQWDWIEHGSILMLVSVPVAPYSWFMDQVVLIPALLQGLYATRSRTMIAILALMSAVIEIGALRGVKLDSIFYLWTAPAWLVWYLFATRPERAVTVSTVSVDSAIAGHTAGLI